MRAAKERAEMGETSMLSGRRAILAFTAMFSLGLGLAGTASAQDAKYPAYPVKTVTLLSSSGPGGGGDVFLRQLTKVLGPRWGINLVVENVTGGGGTNAIRRIMDGPKDGSLLYGGNTQHIITSVLSTPPFTLKDLQPIANVLVDAPVFYVRTDSPFKTLGDVVDYARKNPGKLKFGSATASSPDRMAVETFKRLNKLEMVVATHDSGGQLLISVLSGAVDAGTSDIQEVASQVEAGKVRILAALTQQRIPGYESIPTAQEQGTDVVVNQFRGIVGAKGLPPEVVTAWEQAIKLVLQDPEYKAQLVKNGQLPAYWDAKQYDEVTNKYAADLTSFFKQIGLLK
jgi:putative tricarboxylic transport membrane protein